MSRSSVRSTAAALLLLFVSAIVLAACGGSSETKGGDKGAYERGMRKVEEHITTASSKASGLEPTATSTERADAIQAQAVAIEAAADEAARLDPPTSAAKPHEQLVAALHDYATIFTGLATAAREDDATTQAKLLGEAGTVQNRIAAASKALDKAGYTFGTTKQPTAGTTTETDQ